MKVLKFAIIGKSIEFFIPLPNTEYTPNTPGMISVTNFVDSLGYDIRLLIPSTTSLKLKLLAFTKRASLTQN